jgi:hypothetical protein
MSSTTAAATVAHESINLREMLDGRDWARRVLTRHRAGVKLSPAVMRIACQALNATPPGWAK